MVLPGPTVSFSLFHIGMHDSAVRREPTWYSVWPIVLDVIVIIVRFAYLLHLFTLKLLQREFKLKQREFKLKQ